MPSNDEAKIKEILDGYHLEMNHTVPPEHLQARRSLSLKFATATLLQLLTEARIDGRLEVLREWSENQTKPKYMLQLYDEAVLAKRELKAKDK